MEPLSILYAILITWYAIDTKVELEDLKDEPPRIVKQIDVEEVFISVAARCPAPDDIVKPELLIYDLDPSDYNDFNKISNAYTVSLNQCLSYAEQQEVVLDGYRVEYGDDL